MGMPVAREIELRVRVRRGMESKYWLVAASGTGAVAPLAQTPASAQVQLPTIVIESQDGQGAAAGNGAAQSANTDPSTAIDGYVAESSSTGTKTSTPLREIPQSVSVVKHDQFEDRGADTLPEAISYNSGVAVNPYGLASRFYQFIIRGFEQNTTGVYRDALRLPTFSGESGGARHQRSVWSC
jgi:iron complex outermembrane receptor protein